MKATYEGKQYEIMGANSALDEFNRHKAIGVRKAIKQVEGGYIVIDPLPPIGGDKDDNVTHD